MRECVYFTERFRINSANPPTDICPFPIISSSMIRMCRWRHDSIQTLLNECPSSAIMDGVAGLRLVTFLSVGFSKQIGDRHNLESNRLAKYPCKLYDGIPTTARRSFVRVHVCSVHICTVPGTESESAVLLIIDAYYKDSQSRIAQFLTFSTVRCVRASVYRCIL